ncbi:TPA: hypothetical protein N0F65_004777 [Lagenidium giganteum]|uniref:alpha-1,2-Mannosidase n=1 Tax=Lagenidium giganteum TaxID=4803 RepID=A0AAV2Z9P8_9STRA|nr:TPA: hypothetical protein N0F65_004777 [Lagenidium giganteum]
MESRSRRFAQHVRESPMAPHVRGGGRHGGAKTCSFVLLLQLFVAILCFGMLVQWWKWSPTALVEKNVLHGAASAAPATIAPTLAAAPNLRAEGDAAIATTSAAPAVTTATASAAALGAGVTVAPVAGIPLTPAEQAQRRMQYSSANHNEDQRKVVDMIKWAWGGYERFAFGHDSLNVNTMTGTGLPDHDMALTLVDSLDTLFIVGMFEEFDRASEWVKTNMDARIFHTGFISFFETTIRLLGSLLSTYQLSGHPHMLALADKLGDALSPAFSINYHGMPDKDYDIMRKTSREASSLAEVGTLQMEFKYLARLTGKQAYVDQVERIMDSLAKDVKEHFKDGLLPVQINQHTGRIAAHSKVTLGAMGDSYYEYLLKQWLLSGKKETKYKEQYLIAVEGIKAKLVAKSEPNGLVFIGELVNGKLDPKMDHLVCFVPGMLALGYMNGMPKDHLDLAEQLAETCYQMYAQMATKLAPEIMYFNMKKGGTEDLDVHPLDAFNLLRPETVESLMYLHRITKKPKYREHGRKIMEAFERECKLDRGGYTSISNVAKGPAKKRFRAEMESFFIAETLKYLFLLFSDDSVLPLDEIVFNTEAHPFQIAK